MSARKKRLEAQLAAVRTSSAGGVARRHASPWPLYAVVTGSVLAISPSPPLPSLLAIEQPSAGAENPSLNRAVKLGVAERTSGPNFEGAAPAGKD